MLSETDYLFDKLMKALQKKSVVEVVTIIIEVKPAPVTRTS